LADCNELQYHSSKVVRANKKKSKAVIKTNASDIKKAKLPNVK